MSFFVRPKFDRKFGRSKNYFCGGIFAIFGRPGADFRNFGVENESLEGRFSVFFRKTRFP